MEENIYCLTTTDYTGHKTVFTNKQRELKARQRPELREDGILERVKQTIEMPTFVYEDLEHPHRFAYYGYEYTFNSRSRYMKVIVEDQGADFFIITAYRPDYVKERGKTKLIYGTDNQ